MREGPGARRPRICNPEKCVKLKESSGSEGPSGAFGVPAAWSSQLAQGAGDWQVRAWEASGSASWMASGSSLSAQDCRSYIRIQNLKEPSVKVPYDPFGISCVM